MCAFLSICVWRVQLCFSLPVFLIPAILLLLDEIGITITFLTDKEEAINIQFLMQSRAKFCQNCNAVIERGMKMRPELFASAQEQVME